ncbi:hypothetical protein [Corynebacterium pyruviciproducens]|uniref:DUF3168 domain-containing protein n=1 Tax=Corynebacterium pyruviciproducens TaxID=598660 RepID=A0AAF0YXN8_9CORY|nr:hypothetical protein [Corynebacterium pyruviciproducens]WOT03373.1 hypothetical protein CYJ47_06365 [Corynebacterium pyruviciproducens]
MQSSFPRFQEVLIPILRRGLPKNVKVGSWIEDIDYRDYPIVNIRRVGGPRSSKQPFLLDTPTVEITAYHSDGIIEAEELYRDCIDVIFKAKEEQWMTDAGWISSVEERMGMTQFSSLFQDSWRIQGLVALTIRPPRKG